MVIVVELPLASQISIEEGHRTGDLRFLQPVLKSLQAGLTDGHQAPATAERIREKQETRKIPSDAKNESFYGYGVCNVG